MTGAGRPRDGQVDDQIIDAALEVLADRGFDRFSVEEVVARSGVAKSTVYRRFATREDLIDGVLARMSEDFPSEPSEGTVREQLIAILQWVRQAPGSVSGRILVQASSEGLRQPRIAATVYERVLRPRHEAIRRVIREGVDRGEVHPGVDMEAVVPLLVGPALHVGMWRMCEEFSEVRTERIVDLILEGMSPSSGS